MAEMKVQGRIPVVVPEHLDGAVAAGNSPRVKAKLVDILVYVVGFVIIFGIPRILMTVYPGIASMPDQGWNAVLVVFWPIFGIILVGAYAFTSLYWVSREGQTPGMKIASIRWIRLDDGTRGGSSSIRKFAFELVSGLLSAGLFPLVVWLTSQGEVNRTWFDRVCGTLTIHLGEGTDPSATLGRNAAHRRRRHDRSQGSSTDQSNDRRYALSARPHEVVAQDVSVIGDVPAIGAPAEEMGTDPAPVTSIPIEMSRDYDDIRHSLEQAQKIVEDQDASSLLSSAMPSEVDAPAQVNNDSSSFEPVVPTFAPSAPEEEKSTPASFEVELEPDIDLTTVRGVPLMAAVAAQEGDEGFGVLERTLGFRPVGSIRLVFDDGTSIDLVGEAIIGRDPVLPEEETHVRRLSVMDPSRSVSKTHLKVAVQGDAVMVEDLHSTNGTRITPPTGESRALTPGTPELAEAGSSVIFGRRTFVIGG